MPFGAFCPLPLRLGADPERGWSSQAQSRLAADLVACGRTVPIATMQVDAANGDITNFIAQYGSGPINTPDSREITSGHIGIKWGGAALQNYDETFFGWMVRAVEITVQGAVPYWTGVTYYPSADSDIEIWTWDVATGLPPTSGPILSVTVYGDWLPGRQIGDYDGATDKADSLTEGDASYCHEWFTEMQAMRGSVYSTSPGNVDAENFAIARQLCALSRNAEKLEANSLPGTSDEKLETWVEILGIPVRPTDQRWQIRQRAEAKLKAATSTAQPSDVDAAVQALLGSSFVAAHRIRGTTLTDATPATYWPTVNPGDPSYSLGGGTWTSDRYFYWVEVQQPSSAADADFQRLMNIDFVELLDLRLPAHMTFGWATSDGFILGESLLGFAAL